MDAFFGREFHTMSALSRGIARLSKRRKKQRELPAIIEHDQNTPSDLFPQHLEVPNTAKPSLLGRSMDRLRRSIRQSFKRNRSQESQPPALVASNLPDGRSEAWQPDEAAVRAGVCKFHVKYLGATEVFESRGMPICENALKHLRSLKRPPVKAILHVSGDGLRVVDQENSRGLMVDQTIEKVSFCAPDRNNDKGFAYICRDGTTRRWMCHGFHASKDSGERLSHAVGCAFAICLEKKKKRDEENMFASDKPVTVEKALNPDWGDKNGDAAVNGIANPMQRTNNAYQSFRKQISISERLQDPQSAIVNEIPSSSAPQNAPSIAKPRPVANPALFQRQGSLRAPESSQTSNFRRNCSLRTNMAMAIPERPPNMSLGTIMCKEPIYEGDEDNLVGLAPTNTSAPVTSREVAPPSAQFTDPFGQGFNQVSPAAASAQPATNGVSQQSSSVDDLLDFNSSKTSPTANWADDWLNSALKTSVSSPMTSSSMSVTSNPYSTNTSTVDSPRSGPPPTSAPPPIPQRPPGISQTVKAKETTYTNGISPINTSTDTFGQSINWEVTSPRHVPKPEDPFDIQWSKMAISANNPFATEQPRVISN